MGKKLVDLLITGMLLLAAYFAVFGGDYTLLELRELESLKQEKTVELSAIHAEIDSLETLADRLRHDSAEIERVARERYGMIRGGEILYRFREPENERADTIDGPGGPE